MLVFVVGILAFVAVAVWSTVQQNKRRQELISFCRSQGWTYEQTDPALVTRWQGTPFGRGENRRGKDVVRELNRRIDARQFSTPDARRAAAFVRDLDRVQVRRLHEVRHVQRDEPRLTRPT